MGMTLQIKGSLNYAFSSDSRGDSIWDKASRLTLQPGSGTKDIFKTFCQRNFCRGKKKPTQNQQIQNNKNTHLVMSLRAHVTQMRRKERSEKRRKNISQGFRRMGYAQRTIQVLIIRFLFMTKFLLAEVGLCFPNISYIKNALICFPGWSPPHT